MIEPTSFRQFRDHPESAFYCADGLTPEGTWAAVYDALRHTIAGVFMDKRSEAIAISTEALIGWHRNIFGAVFPDDAGRIRSRDAVGAWEHVGFGINVGTALTRRTRPVGGAHPARIVSQLSRAIEAARAQIEQIETGEDTNSLSEAALVIATVYAKALRIHPFIDGNLRASYVLMQACLLRLDLPGVVFDQSHDAHDEALGFALRVDSQQSYQPFAALVESLIRDADTK